MRDNSFNFKSDVFSIDICGYPISGSDFLFSKELDLLFEKEIKNTIVRKRIIYIRINKVTLESCSQKAGVTKKETKVLLLVFH